MRKLLLPFLVLLPFIGMVGCASNSVEEIVGGTPECDTVNISFSGDIQPIFETNCAISACHSEATQTAGVSLHDYNSIKAKVDDGRVPDRANNVGNPMPPAGIMPECERLKIQTWIDAGAPNN